MIIQNQANRIIPASQPYPSGGSRGGSGGSNEPPFEPKLFHFHGEFQNKLVKLHKSNPPPSANLNPRSKDPGYVPVPYHAYSYIL